MSGRKAVGGGLLGCNHIASSCLASESQDKVHDTYALYKHGTRKGAFSYPIDMNEIPTTLRAGFQAAWPLAQRLTFSSPFALYS